MCLPDLIPPGFFAIARSSCTRAGLLILSLACIASDARAVSSRVQLAPTGAAAGDQLGYSVSTAGDVNGDGYADVIVGAYGNSGGIGRAYVYFGGPGADAISDLTFAGVAPLDQFGQSVSTAGDVNGDGYADLVVGSPFDDSAGAEAGRAYVFFGGPGADTIADLTFTAAAAGDQFGISVSTAGDVNGDGYADVIVGANQNDAGGVDAGRAYVYFGGPGADTIADLTFTAAAAGDQFGNSVAAAGDVNGDGYADVIVGGYANDVGGANAGQAYIFYGGLTADTIADVVLTGGGPFFGFQVASAGDVNGDGFADVIVGAYLNGAGGATAGRAYVYYGGAPPDLAPDLLFTGTPGDQLGRSVSTAGDVNADGYADVIVGAYLNDSGGADAGRAYVYFGGPAADSFADLTFTGAPGDQSGISVSTAGDVNGDGFDDVIVGARSSDASGSDAGRAYLHDFNRHFVLAPNGGESWNVGALRSVSWLGEDLADVFLSVDGGRTYDLLRSRVGGASLNAIQLRVPHAPTKFARIRVLPSDAALTGQDESDSSFTIQVSVALLALLAAPAPSPGVGVAVSWKTDPGPEDLAGYRLERAARGGDWQTIVQLTRETGITDAEGGPGSQYRLWAVNGFGEELWLGETTMRPTRTLDAWPVPFRGGDLSISFATFGGLGGGPGRTELSIVDVQGRLVRTVARAAYPAGYHTTLWDGRDDRGRPVSKGIYFLRARSESGHAHSAKIVVLR